MAVKFTCLYNKEVDCDSAKCDKCGWNPVVAARRIKNYMEDRMPDSKLYKIPFTGYCEVWGETPEEAAEKAEDDELFFVHYEFGDPVCKEDEDELD